MLRDAYASIWLVASLYHWQLLFAHWHINSCLFQSEFCFKRFIMWQWALDKWKRKLAVRAIVRKFSSVILISAVYQRVLHFFAAIYILKILKLLFSYALRNPISIRYVFFLIQIHHILSCCFLNRFVKASLFLKRKCLLCLFPSRLVYKTFKPANLLTNSLFCARFVKSDQL